MPAEKTVPSELIQIHQQKSTRQCFRHQLANLYILCIIYCSNSVWLVFLAPNLMRCEDDELNRLTMCLLFFTRFPNQNEREGRGGRELAFDR